MTTAGVVIIHAIMFPTLGFLYAWRRDFGWNMRKPLPKPFGSRVLYAWRRDFGWNPTVLSRACDQPR